MAFFSEDKIQEIRERASMVSVISQYVNLKKSGVNYKGICPFHSENTPSFMVSETKKIYHCFGCGNGGNVFSFLMNHARLSFPEAVQKLAMDLGISIEPFKKGKSDDQEKHKKELLYKINKLALLFFKEELKKSSNAQAFLKNRKIDSKIIQQYHLGYAPQKWDGLANFLDKKGVSREDILTLGLVNRKESKNQIYDRFRDRIMFPLFDLSQRILGFGGRGLTDETVPKYLNSPESPIYHKSSALYGLSQGASEVSRKGVILVEGYFDCLSLHQAGFQNAVASMGTAFTENHIELLKRFTDQIYVLFDQDEAGKNAAERSLSLFLKAGILPKWVEIDAKDPDDFLKLRTAEDFRQKLLHSRSLFSFVMERVIERNRRSTAFKTKVIEEIIPYFRAMPHGFEREEAIKLFADQVQIEEKWILKSLAVPPGDLKQNRMMKREMSEHISKLDIQLVELIMIFPQWIGDVISEKVLDLLMDLEVKDIALTMIEQSTQKQTIDFSLILEKIKNLSLKETLAASLFKVENQNLSESEWRKEFEGITRKLKKRFLESKEKEILTKLKELESFQNESLDSVKQGLLREYQALVEQRQRV